VSAEPIRVLRALNGVECDPELAEHLDATPSEERPAPPPPLLGIVLERSLLRAERRAAGHEKPIALPWATLADHFGGGLWPGLHVLNSGTGIGKTQFALQLGEHAARASVPVLYIGLELGELDLALRMLGGAARVPWSLLWNGTAGREHLARSQEAVAVLERLPFHFEVARPMGFPASEIRSAIERTRALYPEATPGQRPMLAVVDFLQLVGDELLDERELRVRIGRAAYVLRDAANRLNVAVLCISSIARERYKLLSDLPNAASLRWDEDDNGCPVKRAILDPDAIVGSGKESGEIEYSADSVSVIARVGETFDGVGCDVIFATAKGRATGARWSPMHFTGYRYEECSDRGGRMLEAWRTAAEKRSAAAEQKRDAKEQKKADRLDADARAIAAYVLEHPGCSVRSARVNAVADSGRRWRPAVERLGEALVTEGGCRVHLERLKPEHRPEAWTRGRFPPVPPLPSTSTPTGVDGVDGSVDVHGVHGVHAPGAS